MLPVLNKPFLEHLLHYLRSYQVEDVILTLGYLPSQIESYFGDGSKFGIRLTYVVEESPLGTAGAVKNAEGYLEEPFFTFNGDIFTSIDLEAMLSLHRQRKAKVSIALTPVEDPSLYGVVEMDPQGRVRKFIEKPPWETATTNLINAGIYILDPGVLREVPSHTPFMFEHHLFPQLLEKDVPIYGFPSQAYWMDMGTPEKYLKLHHDLLGGKSTTPLCANGKAHCLIHPTARLEGAVIMGNNCIIEPKAQIKGPTVLGCGCKIREEAVIEEAILWRNVEVGQHARLTHCIVGDNCFIGEKSFLPKGSVLSDNIEVAKGSRLEPGAKIWPNARTG
jgi:mannose-1-phosphate guanylyltransferase